MYFEVACAVNDDYTSWSLNNILQKNYRLAKSIANASWGIFRQMLEYKCEWYGKRLITVDPKNTSRICSKCGYNSGGKPLDIRE